MTADRHHAVDENHACRVVSGSSRTRRYVFAMARAGNEHPFMLDVVDGWPREGSPACEPVSLWKRLDAPDGLPVRSHRPAAVLAAAGSAAYSSDCRWQVVRRTNDIEAQAAARLRASAGSPFSAASLIREKRRPPARHLAQIDIRSVRQGEAMPSRKAIS